MKRVYTIANRRREMTGHGSSDIKTRICQENGNFHPVFRTFGEVREYLGGLEDDDERVIVELEVK